MPIEIPQARALRQIQVQQRKIPIEQIMAVLGHSPVATGIDTAGQVIGQTLTRRAELQRQGQQVAQLAALAQEQAPVNNALTPEMYERGLALKSAHEAKKSLAAQNRVKGELESEKYKTGYSTFDPVTHEETQYPGVKGLSIEYDESGNPKVMRSPEYSPATKPVGGGASGKKPFIIPRGIDPESGRPVFSDSQRLGHFYDDGTPFRGQPGKLTLQSLSETATQKESGLATLKLALGKIKDSYDEKYVGPIASRLGKGKQYVEGMAEPKAAQFYSAVADFRAQIMYMRSGQQINESEYQRLLSTLPNEERAPTDFTKKLEYSQKMLEEIIEARRKAAIGGGYRQTGNLQPITPRSPQSITPQKIGGYIVEEEK